MYLQRGGITVQDMSACSVLMQAVYRALLISAVTILHTYTHISFTIGRTISVLSSRACCMYVKTHAIF